MLLICDGGTPSFADRIIRVYSSGLEDSVQRFLESLGKLNRAYLTALKEKVLSMIEAEYGVTD
ncbi:hypothetical protein NOS3756_56940 (plasmid) [Nostoc sp. NIES-3756]|uniref:hypothetical protein n=1 Tax=Nostoc sp. NIES-3756 TaxID=1751286 RepID=UPI0007207B58|nr:hypothetical protein [Nostoc sp. NIES-3756]BAT56682.1 hypothetical protein NOS3756_56940 [Nostoc sp. NIES-3756]BAY41644.1 hypothetical protein NIES2111_60400 [Nostoc sp. NIES-2111]